MVSFTFLFDILQCNLLSSAWYCIDLSVEMKIGLWIASIEKFLLWQAVELHVQKFDSLSFK